MFLYCDDLQSFTINFTTFEAFNHIHSLTSLNHEVIDCSIVFYCCGKHQHFKTVLRWFFNFCSLKRFSDNHLLGLHGFQKNVTIHQKRISKNVAVFCQILNTKIQKNASQKPHRKMPCAALSNAPWKVLDFWKMEHLMLKQQKNPSQQWKMTSNGIPK